MFTTIAEALVVVALALWTIYAFLKVAGGPNGAKAFDNYIVNFLSSVLLNAAKLLANLEGQLAPIVGAFVSAFQSGGGPLANEMRAPMESFTRGVFNEATSVLEALGESNPDTAVNAAATAMAQAFGSGMASFGVTAAFESLFPEKLNVLNGTGPILAELAGFAEVAEAVRDPLYENAFGKSLKYHYQSLFKPDLPSEGDAVEWHSRGLLTDAQLRTIFNFSGLKAEYEEPYVKAAYRPVSAFIMLRLLESGTIDEATLRDALQFNGYRPQDYEALITYGKWAALTTYRQEYLSATITAAERGVLSDAEVDSNLQDMQVPAGAGHFVHLTIATRKLQQLADIYRKSISEAYHYSLITDAQYVPALEAIGIAQADADAHYAVDSEKKLGQQAAADARALAKAEAAVTRAASKAALLNYQEGNGDAVALAAALAVAGIPAAVIPYAVDVAVLRKQASLRSVFGKLVNPKDAVVLREQVAAIKEQVIKKLLDIPSARLQLENFGVPPTNAQDLVATWAAQALKTVLPVQ